MQIDENGYIIWPGEPWPVLMIENHDDPIVNELIEEGPELEYLATSLFGAAELDDVNMAPLTNYAENDEEATLTLFGFQHSHDPEMFGAVSDHLTL